MPEQDTRVQTRTRLTDPDLKMCDRRWPRQPDEPVIGWHWCPELGLHDVHRCCCGAEEPRGAPKLGATEEHHDRAEEPRTDA